MKKFTLIELMAVILIIGILMGLVSALIPQIRERTRRTQCANNLRNIGLAIESYYQDNGSYDCLTAKNNKNKPNSQAVANTLTPYVDTKATGGSANNVWQCP